MPFPTSSMPRTRPDSFRNQTCTSQSNLAIKYLLSSIACHKGMQSPSVLLLKLLNNVKDRFLKAREACSEWDGSRLRTGLFLLSTCIALSTKQNK